MISIPSIAIGQKSYDIVGEQIKRMLTKNEPVSTDSLLGCPRLQRMAVLGIEISMAEWLPENYALVITDPGDPLKFEPPKYQIFYLQDGDAKQVDLSVITRILNYLRERGDIK